MAVCLQDSELLSVLTAVQQLVDAVAAFHRRQQQQQQQASAAASSQSEQPQPAEGSEVSGSMTLAMNHVIISTKDEKPS